MPQSSEPANSRFETAQTLTARAFFCASRVHFFRLRNTHTASSEKKNHFELTKSFTEDFCVQKSMPIFENRVHVEIHRNTSESHRIETNLIRCISYDFKFTARIFNFAGRSRDLGRRRCSFKWRQLQSHHVYNYIVCTHRFHVECDLARVPLLVLFLTSALRAASIIKVECRRRESKVSLIKPVGL